MAPRIGKLGTVYRPGEIALRTVDGGDGQPRHEFAWSSEKPVKRWFGWEILSHEPKAIDTSRMKRGLPLLLFHDRTLWPGIVEEMGVGEDKKIRGIPRYTEDELGQRTMKNVEAGIWKTASLGYRVLKAERVSVDKDGMETWLVTRWEPVECSLEPIDADTSVGLNRASEQEYEFEMEDGQPSREERTMPDSIVPGTGTPTPAGGEPPPAAATLAVSAGLDGRAAAEIVRMAANNNMSDRVPGWLERGLSPQDVALEIQRGLFRPAAAPQPAAETLVVPRDVRKRYSIRRAIAGLLARHEGNGQLDGVELEVHQELVRNQPVTVQRHNGVLIPLRLRTADEMDQGLEQRTLGTTQPTGGATLVAPQMLDFIDMLRPNSAVLRAGATLLSGLTSPVYWARGTSDPTFYWMDENPPAGVPASEPGYGLIGAVPKSIMGKVPIPRQLLSIASIDVELDINKRLALGYDMAIDRAAVHGKGTDKQPAGIYNFPGVQTHVVGGVPDRDDILGMIGKAGDQNALLDGIGFLTTPLMAGKLKAVPIAANYPAFLWNGRIDAGEMEGYAARATNQVLKTLGANSDEHGLIFGAWPELAICLFGNALEIDLDKVTSGDYGIVNVRAFGMADTAIRHPEAMVVGTGAKIS